MKGEGDDQVKETQYLVSLISHHLPYMVVKAKIKANFIQTFLELIAFCLQLFGVFNKILMRKRR
jgi:hypothetical protein